MPTELFANTATTTLAAAITAAATTLTVASSSLFPVPVAGTSQFRIKIDAEFLIVSDVTGTTWTVTRGAEGSVAAAHLNAAVTTQVLTATALGGFATKWQPLTAYAAGQPVLNPTGDVVAAKVAFTSGVAYVAANWDVVAATAGTATRTALDAAFEGRASVGNRLRRASAAAYRRNSIDLGPMATPPTIATATAAIDATLTKTYRTNVEGLSFFRITGGIPYQGFVPHVTTSAVSTASGAGGDTAGLPSRQTYNWAIEFLTDAPKLELGFLDSTPFYQIEVDDQPIAAAGQAYPGLGGWVFTDLTFTASKVRKIRVEYAHASGFASVNVGPTYTIWAPVSDTNLRVCTVGDSIDTGMGSLLPNGSWQTVAGKLLGWSDVRQVSWGGSGFVVSGSNNTIGSALRVSDTVAHNPDLLIISTSGNDDGQATLQAAALAAMQAYRAALPNVPIIVKGAHAASSGPSAARIATEAAVKAAFTSWADPNSWWLPVTVSTTDTWESGTGTAATRTVTNGASDGTGHITSPTIAFNAGDLGVIVTGPTIPANTHIASVDSATQVYLDTVPPAAASGLTFTVTALRNNGDRDRYGFDIAHPNDLGHLYYGQRFANAFRTTVLAAIR